MIARLDRILGSVTMYLLVIIALAILGVAALVGSLIGQISYPVPDILLSAAVLLIATLGSNRLIGMLLRMRPQTASSAITALLLVFIFAPTHDPAGLGTLAMNWAETGAALTAVDLNETSIAQTRRRFELKGLPGRIEQMDARELAFADGAFDYVYSWGVLHHSTALDRSLEEMMRVLKSGGGFGLMVYNRRSFLHWYKSVYTEAFLHYENRFLGPLELTSRYGDGARAEGNPHTWPETKTSLRAMLGPFSRDLDIRVLGTDLDTIFHALLPGLGQILPAWAKKPWARRFGWSLWAFGHKN